MFGPNISGTLNDLMTNGSDGCSGAFSTEDSWNAGLNRDSDSTKVAYFQFRASDSNATFSGSKLQVSALQALPCIRI